MALPDTLVSVERTPPCSQLATLRRDHLRALAQRVEVAEGEVRIMGSKSRLLQTLVANGGANTVPTHGLNWRREWEKNATFR